MKKELVSIITPAFNCEKYIGETIKSVQNQSYRNWEMIIIDDCSTDNTGEVIRRYTDNDKRIKYKCLTANSGTAVARNEAMKMAQGEYMAFLDADDIWMMDKLKRQLTFMKRNNISFSCTSYKQIDEKGVDNGKIISAIPRTDYNRLLLDCPVGNSTVMYNVNTMGKFEVPNIRKRNDDALWLKMLKNEKYIWGMPVILTKYRVRKDSVSGNKLKVIKYHWILYRDIEHLGIVRSIFHIIYWGVIKLLGIK